ncbi:uncharacterized protein LY79DRAFT_236647 [Colletotrichum navitas]|uniref:Uncharacterized protein n=1 Tax=Colletotrichum navitas TaxID=681940 RepID=A0AAD8V3S7_9PEZI|nr:uncharacterized protein LY79DRAFT_236647 [Colletotrichum navitas]KAK1589622.1 hypothetical protein LY79DRAFT_236647 [Colletotrichum navitas]
MSRRARNLSFCHLFLVFLISFLAFQPLVPSRRDKARGNGKRTTNGAPATTKPKTWPLWLPLSAVTKCTSCCVCVRVCVFNNF